MKKSSKRLIALTGLLLFSLWLVSSAFAATPTLLLTVNPAPPGGTTTATVAISDMTDVESFTLKLDFSSGTSLILPASGWFARGAAFPSALFGSSSPVELNSSFASSVRTRVFMDGFRPSGTSGAIGSVTFDVSAAALNGATQELTLTGEYYAKSTLSAVAFAQVNATANITASPQDGVCGTDAGGTFFVAPSTDLCDIGTVSAIAGSGPWSWSCGGINGGAVASCSAALAIDVAAPVITSFTVPATSDSLTVAMISFIATDNIAVTGYLLSEIASQPPANDLDWSATLPTQYAFNAQGTKTLYAFAKDAAGNISAPLSATVTITLDTTAPVITDFTIPATATSLTVAVSELTATDNVEVTGYLITETASQPQADHSAWTATAPVSHTFATQGVKTLYAFAKDAAGYISVPLSASVTISLSDTSAPTITAFTMPTTASSRTVPVSTLTATDDVAATAYLLTETASQPQANDPAWSVTVPTSYSFASQGVKILYVFVKDAGGNISVPLSVSVTISLADATAPTVTAFTLPATASNRTVPIFSLAATDAVGVTGYLLSETASQPQANDPAWSATEPTSYIFATQGAKTLYAFARDAAGNVSSPRSAAVTITLSDATAPMVADFTLPATSTSLTVPVAALASNDIVDVTGYLLSETSEIPSVTNLHWTTTPTSSYTFANAGSKTLYAWAKDAAGNLSAAAPAVVTISLSDTTAPIVDLLTLPSTATSLTIAVTELAATDDVAVTGYVLSESATPPQPDNPSWTSTSPTSYTLTAQGSRTIYAFAKDAAGNISAPQSATVTITLPDTEDPTVTAFALPTTSTSLTVPILVFTASDRVAVTGYFLSESALTPLAADLAWTSTSPGSYTFTTAGSKTLYAFARDAAGNISNNAIAGTTISLPATAPTVTAFTLPATSTSLIVAISSFTASDDVGVSGYCLAATNNSSACTWSATAPSSYTFTTAGSKTLYAFAKDAAGNISNGVNASTMITLPTVVVYGDLNNDGVTTSTDAMFALQMSIGQKTVDLKADLAPLVNGVPAPNGKVTAADALVILRKSVSLW